MRLYARFAQPVPLWHATAGDRLDVVASGTEDRHSAVVFAINLKSEAAELRLDFAGFNPPLRVLSANSVCDTRQAGQPEVMNHWNVPDRVKTLPLATESNRVLLPPLSATAVVCAKEGTGPPR